MDSYKLSPDTLLVFNLPFEWLSNVSLRQGIANDEVFINTALTPIYEVIVRFTGSGEGFSSTMKEAGIYADILLEGYAILRLGIDKLSILTDIPEVIYVWISSSFLSEWEVPWQDL